MGQNGDVWRCRVLRGRRAETRDGQCHGGRCRTNKFHHDPPPRPYAEESLGQGDRRNQKIIAQMPAPDVLPHLFDFALQQTSSWDVVVVTIRQIRDSIREDGTLAANILL